MSDRAVFLSRVRDAIDKAVLPETTPVPPRVEAPELADVDLLTLFEDRLAAVDGESHRATASDAGAAVVDLLRRAGAATVLAWDDSELPVTGMADELRNDGLTIVDHVTPRRDHATHNLTYSQLDAGVTAAVAGLAESGSIVVGSGPGRPRMASLAPFLHVALLPRSGLHRSLAHLLVERPELVQGTNAVVITGPSRTADIEQQLNLGVHGPRHLHVVVIEDL